MSEPTNNSSRRFASVAGKLAPRNPAPNLHAVTADEPPPPEQVAEARPQETEPESPKRQRRPKRAEPTPQDAGAPRGVVFLAPIEIRDALRARSQADKRSQPNVVLDAIEATHDRLAELLDHAGPERTSLFVRPGRTQQQSTRVPISVRLPTQAVETIDQLVQKHKAASRTDLIVAALRGYLEPEV